MQRVSTSSAVATLPTPPAGGTPGFFAKPDPVNSVAATSPGYAWYNGVQEELMAVIEGQGLTGNTSNNTQLRTAITKMIQAGQRSVVINNAVFAATVTTGKAVYWDAVNSRFDLALADGSATQNCVGFADVANGNVYSFGVASLFGGLTPGRYYLSTTVAGAITAIAPALNPVPVGTMRSVTDLFVDIDPTSQFSQLSSYSGIIRALKITNIGTALPNSQVAVTADEILVEGGANPPISLKSITFTLSTQSVGPNGLDAGAVAALTWYSVWGVYNPTSGVTAGLLSLSATSPQLPSGFTHKARLGWIRTNSATNLIRTMQLGRRAQYIIDGVILTTLPQLSSGVQGNIATPTFVAIPVSAFIPPTASRIQVQAWNAVSVGSTQLVAPNPSYGSYGSGAKSAPIVASLNSGASGNGAYQQGEFILESSNIYVASDNAGNGAAVLGWEDNL